MNVYTSKKVWITIFLHNEVSRYHFFIFKSRLKSREFQLEQAQRRVENKSEKENIINQPTIHRDLDWQALIGTLLKKCVLSMGTIGYRDTQPWQQL